MTTIEYKWRNLLWIIGIFIVAFLATYFLLHYVFADDDEDPGRPTLYDQLLKRAQEWNINKAINETLALAEKWNLNHSAHGDSAVCFSKLSDYFKFRLEHNENYTVMYPCPDNANLLNQTIPKDESGR